MKPISKLFLAAALAITALATPARAADYAIDASHASAMFSISHLGFSKVQGAIKDISGEFTFDPENADKSSVTVTLKAASIDTFNEGRDKHLRNADFLDVEKYPELGFKSKSWKKTGDKTYDVTGDFTLHGVTKIITVPVVHIGSGKGMQGEERAGFSCSFKIKRSDFGMDKMLGDSLIGDEVSIEISFEGVKK
jgi:polyisoprenoid-binding protein YceI